MQASFKRKGTRRSHFFLLEATWIKIPSHIWSHITSKDAKRWRVGGATLALLSLSTVKSQCLDIFLSFSPGNVLKPFWIWKIWNPECARSAPGDGERKVFKNKTKTMQWKAFLEDKLTSFSLHSTVFCSFSGCIVVTFKSVGRPLLFPRCSCHYTVLFLQHITNSKT